MATKSIDLIDITIEKKLRTLNYAKFCLKAEINDLNCASTGIIDMKLRLKNLKFRAGRKFPENLSSYPVIK